MEYDDFVSHNISSGDVIILAASISSPDICANQHSYAWLVNVTNTSKFIEQCLERDAKVIFLSSDAVLGERYEPCDESANPAPLGEYAKMKYEVERRFLGRSLFKVVRLSYVFSRWDKFTQYLIKSEEFDKIAEIFNPFNRAIIHVGDVVDGLISLALNWNESCHQLVHFGGPRVLARIELANELKLSALPDLRLEIKKPSSDFFQNRPREINFTSPKLNLYLKRPSRDISEAIKIEFKESNDSYL